MASITLTVPDNLVNRISDGLGWNSDLGVTRAVYIKTWIISRVKAEVAQRETDIATAATRSTAYSDAQTNVTIS